MTDDELDREYRRVFDKVERDPTQRHRLLAFIDRHPLQTDPQPLTKDEAEAELMRLASLVQRDLSGLSQIDQLNNHIRKYFPEICGSTASTSNTSADATVGPSGYSAYATHGSTGPLINSALASHQTSKTSKSRMGEASGNKAVEPRNPFRTPSLEEDKVAMDFSGPQEFVKITTGTGSKKHTSTVHKKLICAHSPYFAATFDGGFSEAVNGDFLLEDIEADTVDMLVNWLYRKSIQTPQGDRPTKLQLAKLFIASERFLLDALNTELSTFFFQEPDTWRNVPYFDQSALLAEMTKVFRFAYSDNYDALQSMCLKYLRRDFKEAIYDELIEILMNEEPELPGFAKSLVKLLRADASSDQQIGSRGNELECVLGSDGKRRYYAKLRSPMM